MALRLSYVDQNYFVFESRFELGYFHNVQLEKVKKIAVIRLKLEI